jgi:hypothetical protein
MRVQLHLPHGTAQPLLLTVVALVKQRHLRRLMLYRLLRQLAI